MINKNTTGMEESHQDMRLRCWESAFDRGVIEGLCPVCQCSTIRYKSTTGTTFQKLHIIPLSQGGRNDSSNLVPGCGCNQNMGSTNLIDWMGTRGNKKGLIRPLFLRKYKSLVAPYHRSPTNREQLIEWVKENYNPLFLSYYEDWLILLDNELSSIQEDGIVVTEVPHPKKIEKTSPYFSRKHQQSF